MNDGSIKHLSWQAIVGETGAVAASGLLRDGGVDRLITALADSAQRTEVGATDSAEIIIIRNGSVV